MKRLKPTYAGYVIFIGVSLFGTSTVTAQIGQFAESIRQKTLGSQINPIHKVQELSDTPVDLYIPPNQFHDPGDQHLAMYRGTHDGVPTLIKIIFPNSRSPFRDRFFRQEIFGMQLASDIGGPKIYRTGSLLDSQGQVGYFIEMQEIYPGDRSTFTFKGWRSKSYIKRLFSLHSISKAQLDKIGEMLGMAIERSINILDDGDLIFSSLHDDVRWIDTSRWMLATKGYDMAPDLVDGPITGVLDLSKNNIQAKNVLSSYAAFIDVFFSLRKDYGVNVLGSLLAQINRSTVWSDAQKVGLTENLKKVLVDFWNVPQQVFEESVRKAGEEKILIRGNCSRSLTIPEED